MNGYAIITFILAVALPAAAADWKDEAVPRDAGVQVKSDLVWYRCHIQVPDRMVVPEGTERDLWRSSMVLGLGDMPGKFEVFLNGKSIVASDGVPVGKQRRFKVPKDILKKGAYNALVIRLEGGAAERGLTRAPMYFGYFSELEMVGAWQASSTAPAAADLESVAEQPPSAFYTASQFRRASTVFDPTAEPTPGKRVSPAEALAALQVEDDLIVEEILHEPLVAQPTHFSFDARGRLWVAQYRQYPFPAGLKMISRDQYYRSKYDRVPPPPPNHDRGADIISVHEDTDGDGVYDSHKNVIEGLNMANAVLHGGGGIWVMQTPYLLFYPDADGDDVPDGDPEVRLAGFGLEDTHSVANGLAWGPDGWIYGAQGSTTTSRVVRPGTKDVGVYNEGCMVWRYHPKTRIYEMFADGSGNTFGLSFDAEGRLFSGHNGGNTRGWHHIQEGIYLKQGKSPGKFGPPPNPYAFGEMPMMKSTHPIPRFSHMLVSVDAAAMPDRLQGKFLSVDPIHHYLIASERHVDGSTFSTTDIGFPLRTDDLTFRPVYLANSPDGSITIADFREEYIAHGQNYQGQIDPESGRIYRLRGKGVSRVTDVNLASKTTAELVGLLSHDNMWHRQTAARLLGERGEWATVAPLRKLLLEGKTAHPSLEAMWALHQMRTLDERHLLAALEHPAPMVRAWAVRLIGDIWLRNRRKFSDEAFQPILKLAQKETDREVRSQMLGTARRMRMREGLSLVWSAVRGDDSDDPFIPLMAWFTIEAGCDPRSYPPSSGSTWQGDMALISISSIASTPLMREHLLPRLMRRFAAEETRSGFNTCSTLLAYAKAHRRADVQAALLSGFEQAFEGRPLPDLPDELAKALADAGSGSLSFRIRGGEEVALGEGLALLGNASADLNERISVARAFGALAHPPARDVLLKIALDLGEPNLRAASFSALQRYDGEGIAESVIAAYPKLPGRLGESALSLLVSRKGWGQSLLRAESIPDAQFSQDVIERLRLHDDPTINGILDRRFPGTNVVPIELAKRVAEVRKKLAGAAGDPYRGEKIYESRCLACHVLFHKGGNIGPELTSYQREDLSTLLPSLLDPSAEIREGFETYMVKTKDGRALSGFLTDQDGSALKIRGLDGAEVALYRRDIEKLEPAGRSLMPAGLLDDLTDQQLRDFFAYLRIPQPISP